MAFYNAVILMVTYRANYKRFSKVISPTTNNILYYVGVISTVTGPMVAYFDRYSDVFSHTDFAVAFTLTQIIYLFSFVGILNANKS